MNQRDYFDNQLQERFTGFNPEPPPEAWHVIEQAIAPRKVKRLIPGWFRAAATVAALVTAGFSLWFFPQGSMEPLRVEGINLPGELHRNAYSLNQALADPMPVLPSGNSVAATSTTLLAGVNRFDDVLSKQLPVLKSPKPLQGKSNLLVAAVKPSLAAYPHSGTVFPVALSHTTPVILDLAVNQSGSKYPEITLGAHVITQYNYRQIISSGNYGVAGIPFESLEEPLYTLSYGLSLTVGFSDRWALQTGLNYRNMGQYMSDIMSFSSPDGLPLFEMDRNQAFYHPQTIISSQGSIRLFEPTLYFADTQSFRVLTNKQFVDRQDPKSLSQREQGLSQYTSFLEIPLMIRMKVLENNIGLHLKGGMSGTYLIRNGVFLGTDLMQTPIGETYGLRNMNFSALGGVILSIPMSRRLTLHLEPTGQIFLMPMVKDDLHAGRVLPYNFSIFSSVTFGF